MIPTICDRMRSGMEAARPPPPALYLSLSPHTWPFWEAVAGAKWPDGVRGEERQAGCWFSFRRSALPAGLSETEINTAGASIYKPPPPLLQQTQFQPLPVSTTPTSGAPCLHRETWLQAASVSDNHAALGSSTRPEENDVKLWRLFVSVFGNSKTPGVRFSWLMALLSVECARVWLKLCFLCLYYFGSR